MNAGFWAAVAIAGGVGALARFLLDAFVSSSRPRPFPWGTLAVNLSGAAILGLIAGAAAGDRFTSLVGTALIGSYTTFSTWMLESQRLDESGEGRLSAANLVLSSALGLAAVAFGRALGGWLG